MSTVTTEPTAKVQVSTKIAAAVKAVIAADVQKEIALDNYRNVAKSESVRLALSDKKALTAVLFASGDGDARRISEVVGFVFPKTASARVHLDAAMAQNAKQTDPKKRIAKGVILALQRDDTGKLTLDKAIAAHKAASAGQRSPGGQTAQTTKTKKKTQKEIEAELTEKIVAALKFAAANEYDIDDFNAIVESNQEEVFSDGEGDGDGEEADDAESEAGE